MEEKCIKCGGELISGEINCLQPPMFYPLGEAKKISPKRSMILCDCCKECGNIQNFRVKELEKIK